MPWSVCAKSPPCGQCGKCVAWAAFFSERVGLRLDAAAEITRTLTRIAQADLREQAVLRARLERAVLDKELQRSAEAKR